MKFLSVIILLALMSWTWTGYKNTAGISVTTHIELQTDLKNFISSYILEHEKGASNIQFIRFWTEPTNTKEVRAVFEYTFDTTDEHQDVTTTQLQGNAYLAPQESSNEWSLDRVEINDQIIEFKTGSVVNPPDKANDQTN